MNNNLIKKYKEKIIKIFNKIKKNTNSDLQILTKIKKENKITIKNQKINNIEFNKNIYINIIVYFKKHKYIIILNNFNKKNIKKCINYINNSIKYTKKDIYNILPNKKKFLKKYKKNLGIYFNENININDSLNIIKNIEKNTLNINKNIFSDGTSFIKKENIYIIYNNYKHFKIYRNKKYLLIHNIIMKIKDLMEYESIYIYKNKLSDLINKYHFLSKKIINKIKFKFNQKKILTQNIPVIFNNEISTEIFTYLINSIYGNNIYNKISFLYKKLNKKILPKWISIIEDPFFYKGIGSKPFDNEGMNTKKYYVIKNGILKTWILNSYYSSKLNIENTCNDGGIHNWIFKKENKEINFKKLINIMKTGIIIDKLLGQGININTGFYSKGISGFYVENKKIKFYINEATISGNLKYLFKNIINMSNDINHNSKIKCGSILIKKILVTSK